MVDHDRVIRGKPGTSPRYHSEEVPRSGVNIGLATDNTEDSCDGFGVEFARRSQNRRSTGFFFASRHQTYHLTSGGNFG